MMTLGSSKKGTDLFLISGKQIRAWRKECVKAINVRFDDPRCLGCEFVGTGVRYHCCDFDDNAMEKIFRSRPYNPEQEKAAAILGMLEKLRERTWRGYHLTCSDIDEYIAELRQQQEEGGGQR